MMKKNKWETSAIYSVMITCIVVFLALIQQGGRAESGDLQERIIKFVVLGLIAAGTLLFFLLHKNGFASRIRLSTGDFTSTSVLGLI